MSMGFWEGMSDSDFWGWAIVNHAIYGAIMVIVWAFDPAAWGAVLVALVLNAVVGTDHMQVMRGRWDSEVVGPIGVLVGSLHAADDAERDNLAWIAHQFHIEYTRMPSRAELAAVAANGYSRESSRRLKMFIRDLIVAGKFDGVSA